MKQVKYTLAPKFVNAEDYSDIAPYKTDVLIQTSYGEFDVDGRYTIKKGYLYSANFPAINTKNSRRGAMIHDFFYDLIKDGYLARIYKQPVDQYFHQILLEDKMTPARAAYWLKAVQLGGDAALDAARPPVLTAPVLSKDVLEPGWQLKKLM